MEKMTYSKALATVIATLADGEVKDKLVALKASVDKKNSAERKPNKEQLANEGIKAEILAGMEDNTLYTITDLQKNIPALAEYSNQKVSALVRQLVECGKVARKEDKRKALFVKVAD